MATDNVMVSRALITRAIGLLRMGDEHVPDDTLGETSAAYEACIEALAVLNGTAPTPADERAAFEAWAATEWTNGHVPHTAWLGWAGRAGIQPPAREVHEKTS